MVEESFEDQVKRLFLSWAKSHYEKTELDADDAREIWSLKIPEPWGTVAFLQERADKDHRCGVCGNTPAQSEAIGYDCARGC